MTSKLKRKLDNMGIDVQSNSPRFTENFCLIGTPLPPLEKTKDAGEFVPVWKQDVRDEKGRRRLHGAFTGGFSAGYFNTVGSKEGWVPSTFSSSRSERATKKQAKPEDFMDEEDLEELRDSKKLVDLTEETDLFGGTQAELARRGGHELEKDSMASTLESLLPPAKDSVGARLLKKMGWRLGQGIGPRISYKQLRLQEGNPIDEDEVVDEEASKHLYAPRDTQLIVFHKKEDAFGLGYKPGQGLNNIVHDQSGQAIESGPKLSAGFGLGALNDAEDDDIDVYDHKPTREHRRMAFDVNETEDEDRITLSGSKSGATHNATGSVATFHDGRPIVSGFVLFGKPLIENRWFPIPDVPKGWSPDPRRVWATDPSASQDENKSHPQALPLRDDHQAWLQGKTAEERGAMLGETPIPKPPRSVFDYLSQKDRDRLKNLSSSLASGTTLPKEPQPLPTPIDIPDIDSRTAQAALKGFQPFTTEPTKQSRYTIYLQSQASPDSPKIKPLPGQSNEKFNKEVADYAKAARIFKPVSGAMAGRFTTASTVEMLGNTRLGLHKPSRDDYARLESQKEEEAEKEAESPKAHVARMEMFGPLTREVKVWQPARLLCKRFGVKDPYPDGVPGEDPPNVTLAKSDAWQAEVMKGAPNFNEPPTSVAASGNSTDTSSTPQNGKRDLANIGLGEDEEQGKDTLTYERPAKDIFKAIFASDEDSDEEADIEADESQKEVAISGDGATSAPTALQETSNAKSYQPVVPQTEQVDLSSFRPTFVRKSERAEQKKDRRRDGDEEKKEKKDKKKKGKMVVSFEVEDESEDRGKATKQKTNRPRKRRKERSQPDEDESMWVEKPPLEIVKDLVIPISTEPEETDELPRSRGRKRAVDFL